MFFGLSHYRTGNFLELSVPDMGVIEVSWTIKIPLFILKLTCEFHFNFKIIITTLHPHFIQKSNKKKGLTTLEPPRNALQLQKTTLTSLEAIYEVVSWLNEVLVSWFLPIGTAPSYAANATYATTASVAYPFVHVAWQVRVLLLHARRRSVLNDVICIAP